ncbi:FecR domain-containing protein [Fulvivirga maritima]|uniref:FecR family protein n=1 Tax=Fulvivirga maritima TaxID=2904247 RepID=UPI001F39D1E1|nr:FecR domain-containing protein [Fulvivirga maritima]UII25394.1 FecR domain-containing protein [Fulvivirga maritima]
MDKDKFHNLLKLYSDDKLSAQGKEELMAMVSSGEYELEVQEYIDSMLHSGDEIVDMSKEASDRIISGIIRETTSKVVPMYSWKFWTGIAATFLMLAVFTYQWLKPDTHVGEVKDAEYTAVAEDMEFDGKQYIQLPDGSTVILNDKSKLAYTKDFGDTVRRVQLEGEGYFDIAHDENKPFIVESGKVKITVLGTAFNINAYPDKKEVLVTVNRGKVRVEAEEAHKKVDLTPNEQAVFNTATSDLVATEVTAEPALSWKSNYLIFDDLKLSEAMAMIEQQYDVDVTFENEDLGNCRFTATFLNNENLEQVLSVVLGVVNAEYSYDKTSNEVFVTGKGCQ